MRGSGPYFQVVRGPVGTDSNPEPTEWSEGTTFLEESTAGAQHKVGITLVCAHERGQGGKGWKQGDARSGWGSRETTSELGKGQSCPQP